MQFLNNEDLESRTYQEVIAASAIKDNTLVVLPTGLGKTVIAAMVSAKKLEDGKILFLAPTKPLVEQHLRSFKQFIDIKEDKMVVMTGKTRPNQRYKLWKKKKVFFATPQVVENDLIADEIPIEDFSLVIFDEAHKATGEYSYVFISEKMKTHKLALTASPGGSKEKIMDVAEKLEINNYEVRTEDDPDVEPYIEDKQVDWIHVKLDKRFEDAKKSLDNSYRTQLKQLKKLGQLNTTSNVHKGQLLKIQGKIGSKLSNSDDPKLYKAISTVATAIKISQAVELLETQGVSQCYNYMRRLEEDDSKAAKRALNNKDFQNGKSMVEYLKKKGEEHPKVDKLRELIGDMDKDEKALVFTEYRDSTEKIAEELNTEGLNAVKFVGQQGDKGMTQKKQAEVLQAFSEGKFNVVVSTSIGEEGLDIPSVDYVIFYEPVASGIRDIQRAGRTGRQESGKVYVLMAENTRDEGHYWSAHHKKKKMNKVLNELKNEVPEDNKEQKTLAGYQGKKKKEEDREENETLVIADDRENSVSKKLSKMDIKVQKKRLEVADFLVAEETAIERKKTEDFVDSLIDQRLFSQIKEMHQFDNPIIIIEGDDLHSHRRVHPNAIRGALASLASDHNLPTIWTDDEEETAEMLKILAEREQEEKDKDIAVRGSSGPKSEIEMQKFIVAGLPDVNTKLAKRLLGRFGNIENIFTASEEELKNVEGIGEKKAGKIKQILKLKYEEEK